MKLRTLIIDDEPLAHNIILKYSEDVPFLEISGQCYSAMEAITFLNLHQVDLVFLDIQMPKINGLDLLRTLNQKPLVVITSAFEEYALQSFELDVCDYLLKPFRFDRFLKATNKVLELKKLKSIPIIPPGLREEKPASEPGQLYIKCDNRFVQTELKDVFYLESYGNYVKVWLEDHFLLTPKTLTSFELQLPASNFLRIHKSFIINRKHVKYLEGNRVILKNGMELPIGKNHKQVMRLIINDND